MEKSDFRSKEVKNKILLFFLQFFLLLSFFIYYSFPLMFNWENDCTVHNTE